MNIVIETKKKSKQECIENVKILRKQRPFSSFNM